MAKRAAPEVNAGSMADIAFLLLIFFLVTTTIPKDSGINRKLPPIDDQDQEVVIKEKNIFTVLISNKDQLLVEEQRMELKDIRAAAIAFLDNGGDGSCTYCKGKRDQKSSDNPDKAIISLKNERETSYAMYISVQNELVAAYNTLRNTRAEEIGPKRGFSDMNFVEMEANLKDPKFNGNKEKLKELVDQIRSEYPEKLSEVQ